MTALEDSSRSANRKFSWRNLSLKKWLLNRRRQENSKQDTYYHDADDQLDDDDLDSELDDLGVWDFEVDQTKRYSCCSAGEFQLNRSFSTGFTQPRYSSASIALMPKNCEILQSKFTDIEHIRVFVGTWNVGGRPPNEKLDMEEWLGSLKEPADIYVIGFQEVVPLSAGNILGGGGEKKKRMSGGGGGGGDYSNNRGPAAKWQNLIRQTLDDYSNHNHGTSSDILPPITAAAPPRNGGVYSFQRSTSTSSSSSSSSSPRSQYCRSTAQQNCRRRHCSPVHPASDTRCRSNLPSAASPRFAMVASKQMVGLFVSVWVKSHLRRCVRHVNVSCIGCGLMGYLGNKGSISVSMCVHETTFCFVCSHLASGERDGDEMKRNSDVADILKRTHFRRSTSTSPNNNHTTASSAASSSGLPETILEHDRVIWLGDLNYRLALSPRDTRSLLAKEDWDALLEKDQLQIQRRAGRVFRGWHEGKIYFAPTYKYRTNSDSYTLEQRGSKKRTPAWCDRILWYGNGLTQLAYVRAETKFSDHRPVYAVFSAEVEVLSKDKLKDFLLLKSSSAKVQVEELLLPPPLCEESHKRKSCRI